MDLSHLKGAARIEAAHRLYPWLTVPEYSEPLDLDQITSTDTLVFAGVYTIAGTVWGEPLTLYAGETECIANRIEAHFSETGHFFDSGFRHRIEAFEAATGPCENLTLSAWRIKGGQVSRRSREREALDALGAALEHKDRRAASCLPARLSDALREQETIAAKQSAGRYGEKLGGLL